MKLNRSLAKTVLTTAVSATVLSLAAAPSFAAALGNITASTTAANLFDTTGIDSDTKKAVSFTTDDNTYTLLDLRMWLSGTDNSDLINISIREANTGNPDTGTIVTGFTNPSPPFGSGLAIYSLNPTNTSAMLMPNTTYYLYADIDSTATYSWAIEDADPGTTGYQQKTPTSTLGWTFNQYLFSNDGGATFGTSGLWNGFEINAEIKDVPPPAVPEPGSIVGLLTIGLLGSASVLKNRHKN